MPDSPILLAITMWLTWDIRPVQSGTADITGNDDVRMSSVSLQRLWALGSRLEANADRPVAATAVHQLVRFNLFNLGEQSVTVCAITLKNLQGEVLSCDLVPDVVVRAGARYPVMVEITRGPVAQGADIEVDVRGQHSWISAQGLPKS